VSHGIAAYQQRVPLQLMDFAYRYTSTVLSDALYIQTEAYDQVDGGTQTKGRGAKQNPKQLEEGDISIAALRMAIGSKVGHQFQGSLPKEFLKNLADERNRISLTSQARGGKRGPMVGGLKLPHEKYCLSGVGWGLKDEWDSEGEESPDEEEQPEERPEPEDIMMDDEAGGDGDEEGMGNMEDVFGPDDGGGDKDGDEEMEGL